MRTPTNPVLVTAKPRTAVRFRPPPLFLCAGGEYPSRFHRVPSPRQIPRIYRGSSRTNGVLLGLRRTPGRPDHIVEIAGDRLAALCSGVLIAQSSNGRRVADGGHQFSQRDVGIAGDDRGGVVTEIMRTHTAQTHGVTGAPPGQREVSSAEGQARRASEDRSVRCRPWAGLWRSVSAHQQSLQQDPHPLVLWEWREG